MPKYRLLSFAIISLFAAGDSYAAAVLQPIPTGTFLPLREKQIDDKKNLQPLLADSSHFMSLTPNQMSKVLPRAPHVTAPLSKSTAPLAALPSRSAESSDMTEDEAQQILSLFSAYQ